MIAIFSARITAAVSLGTVWGTVWPILIAVLLFGIVVFVHEFGHYFFAKLMGVQVNEFSIGFGPTLMAFQKGETKYSWRLLPFGGFCAMEGEDKDSESNRAFGNRPVWRRMVIVAAGAINNIILGIILVSILLAMSGRYGTTTVAAFNEGAISSSSGLQANDQILRIDGRRIYCSTDISYMMMNSPDETIDMVVLRSGHKVGLEGVRFHTENFEGVNYIQMDFKVYGEDVSIRHPLKFLKESLLETMSIARLVWITIIDMISGRYGLNQIMGPVGTITTVGKAVSIGIEQVLYIIALITINLGVVNLLPLPALDGGRLVFLTLEGIRRKPIPPKYEGVVHGIGFALLMVVLLIVTGSDILRLIR